MILGKLLKLYFIIYLARDHIRVKCKLIKLGKSEKNYTIGFKACQKQYHYSYSKIIGFYSMKTPRSLT